MNETLFRATGSVKAKLKNHAIKFLSVKKPQKVDPHIDDDT